MKKRAKFITLLGLSILCNAYPLAASSQPITLTDYTYDLSWNGPYIGLSSGVDFTYYAETSQKSSYLELGSNRFLVAGLFIGNNFVTNSGLFAGIDADLNYKTAVYAYSLIGLNSLNYVYAAEAGVRGRVGFATNSALFYIAGGRHLYNNARIAGPDKLQAVQQVFNWQVAAGIEFRLSKFSSYFFRLEFRHDFKASENWQNIFSSNYTETGMRLGLGCAF